MPIGVAPCYFLLYRKIEITASATITRNTATNVAIDATLPAFLVVALDANVDAWLTAEELVLISVEVEVEESWDAVVIEVVVALLVPEMLRLEDALLVDSRELESIV